MRTFPCWRWWRDRKLRVPDVPPGMAASARVIDPEPGPATAMELNAETRRAQRGEELTTEAQRAQSRKGKAKTVGKVLAAVGVLKSCRKPKSLSSVH